MKSPKIGKRFEVFFFPLPRFPAGEFRASEQVEIKRNLGEVEKTLHGSEGGSVG